MSLEPISGRPHVIEVPVVVTSGGVMWLVAAAYASIGDRARLDRVAFWRER